MIASIRRTTFPGCDFSGIYEQLGLGGSYVKLRELLTGDEFTCLVPAGYRGKPGNLWYVRLLPPVEVEVATFHVAFTTPYILNSSKSDWIEFLKRSLQRYRGQRYRGLPECKALHQLLKYGSQVKYWNEFVFVAYYHHQPDAIFLTRIPDLPRTLPHANGNRESTKVDLQSGQKVGLDLTAAEREIVLTKLLCLEATLERSRS